MVRSFALLLACLVATLPACAQDQCVAVHVRNPSALPRNGELAEVPWQALVRLVPSLTPSALAAEDSSTGNVLPSQVIDLDADGTPDFLLVQVDIPPGGSTAFRVVHSTSARTSTPSLTDARFVPPREDLAWENDRVAFRMYGPALAGEVDNGIDVWTKRVRTLIVRKWYKAAEAAPAGQDPYHVDHGEGADYFSVGRSLGAGACALISGDTLIQPGVFSGHRIIATGPLRAMFELTYKQVRYGTLQITQKMRISIDAGTNLNRIDVLFDADGVNARVPFAAGLVKRKGVTPFADSGYCSGSLWGLTTEKPEEGFLGTGIVMPRSSLKRIRETPVHLLLVGEATTGRPETYYAGAGWTKSGDFGTEQDWHEFLQDFSSKLLSPLRISCSRLD